MDTEQAQALINSLVGQRNQALDNLTRVEAAAAVMNNKLLDLQKQLDKKPKLKKVK